MLNLAFHVCTFTAYVNGSIKIRKQKNIFFYNHLITQLCSSSTKLTTLTMFYIHLDTEKQKCGPVTLRTKHHIRLSIINELRVTVLLRQISLQRLGQRHW